jgi:hypothetical protein
MHKQTNNNALLQLWKKCQMEYILWGELQMNSQYLVLHTSNYSKIPQKYG